MIGGIDPIKIRMHMFEFFSAIARERFHAFINQALVVLFAKELPKILVVSEFQSPARQNLFGTPLSTSWP
jgi:hypothetical protein